MYLALIRRTLSLHEYGWQSEGSPKLLSDSEGQRASGARSLFNSGCCLEMRGRLVWPVDAK